jgi:cytochrome c-type biogenesis protein CcmH
LPLFWFLAGMLCALACVIVMLPWLRRIPRFGPLPAVPWPVALGAAVLAVAVLGLYRWLGRPELPATVQAAPSAPSSVASGANSSTSAGSMNSAIASLEARLAKGGGTADDWELLAKSYEFLGRSAEAANARARHVSASPGSFGGTTAGTVAPAAAQPTLSADSLQWLAKAGRARHDRKMSDAAEIFSQLAARGQMNADSWADYADTAASLRGGKLAGEPEVYIAKALALDPAHAKALWLKASADEEAGRFAEAALAWQRLLTVLPPNSADAKLVAATLQNDTILGSPGKPDAAPAAASGVAVSGEVSLAPSLSAKAGIGATLFIVAKSVDSPGIPVAVFRGNVGAWPVKFTLNDSLSMLPGRNLSNAGRVTIEARISQSGQALPAAGDLQGTTGVIDPTDHTSLKIVIDKVIT